MSTFTWAPRASPAWDAAWEALRKQIVSDQLGDGSDLLQAHPVLGDGWQYMGSSILNDIMVHDFRHRCHPGTEAREYRSVRTDVLSLEGELQDDY